MSNHWKAFSLVTLVMILIVLLTPSQMTRVLALQPPVAQFTHAPQLPLVNQTVTFDASASYDPDGTIMSYQWVLGDGTPPFSTPENTVTHAYSAIGNYTVTLTVTDNDGLKGNASGMVTVHWYPSASFTYTPTRPLVNQVVAFNASASAPNGGVIVSYFWSFGDGNTANLTSSTTTHVYLAVGNYTATLTVTDSYGLSDSCTKSINVVKNPSADFTFSPTYPIVGETVTFNASASKANSGVIISYFWNFGDGNYGTGQIATHMYITYGSFTVTLNVTNSENLSDVTSKQVNVRQYPTASFTFTPGLPSVNATVTFNATASNPRGGTIVSYLWNFGDGQTGTGVIATHAYAMYGTYLASLQVTDSEGLNGTTSHSIRVIIKPVANFTYAPTYPRANRPVFFNASQSYDPDGSIVSYAWDFGDGNVTTVSGPLISHIYAATNVYRVTLTVTDSDGLTDNATTTLAVYTPLHDVAIVDVVLNRTLAYEGYGANISVAVLNNGDFTENVTVILYYNMTANKIIGSQANITLVPGQSQTVLFVWDTSGVAKGNYTISAYVVPVPGEIETADNTLTDGMIRVVTPGDINGDGKIDVKDIYAIALAYGTWPGLHKWNPVCDINNDGKCDLKDYYIACRNYGKVDP